MFHRLKKHQSMDGNVPLCKTTYEEVDLGVGKLPRYFSEARCGGRCMGGIGTCEALYISEQVHNSNIRLYPLQRELDYDKHIALFTGGETELQKAVFSVAKWRSGIGRVPQHSNEK
uniref:Acyl-CoA dehydrogenase/oxidase C-terminal domain-containing protein n=1 Tax=Parascaris univalens TaxID=6257 RepID=A0A914ZGF9_PARUN